MSFLVYKSSAGSGKTFTLVKEYLKIALATDNASSFGQILAITFTNKAANEMTDRIIETLEEIGGVVIPMSSRSLDMMKILTSELKVTDEVIKKRSHAVLKKIVHNYRDFSVGTIDSFVHKIIRSFAHEMGLNQQFEVELNAENVLKRAIDMMLDRVGIDPVLTQFIQQYADEKADKGSSWKIETDLFDFSRQIIQTHNWYYLEQATDVGLKTYREKYSLLTKSVKKYEKTLFKIAKEAVQVALDGVEKSSYASRGVLVNYFVKITNGDYNPDLGKTIPKLLDGGNWAAQKAPKAEKDIIESRKDQLTSYLEEVESIRKARESQYVFDKLILSNIYKVALLTEINNEIQKIKKQNDLVLISDFTELVGEITRVEPVPFIYEKLGERYKHLLFDEFQDTSLMQWQNVLPLVENCLSENGTAMVVGDAKQSIYRWRGGEAMQFELFPEVYNPYNDLFTQEREEVLQRNYNEPKKLNKNYRSNANIVLFNNAFFEEASRLLEQDLEGFYVDVKQEIKDEQSGGLVHFSFIHGKKVEEANEEIYERITELIPQLQSQGYALKDIAILTKRKKITPDLVEYLHESGIDVVSSESLLVVNSGLVKLCVAILHHLNQPEESFYMAEVLVRLNQVIPNSKFQVKAPLLGRISPSDFKSMLLEWGITIDRGYLLSLPIYELVTGVIESLKMDTSKDNRLAAWLDYVYNFSLKAGRGVFDLLETWKGDEDKLSIQIPEDVDAVNIMTIHKAKGLDWPVVIVAEGNWQESINTHSIWVEVPESNPIPVAILPHNKVLNETVFKADYEEESRKVVLDNINAMYVAFTRPAERLYVFSTNPKKNFFGKIYEALEELSTMNLSQVDYNSDGDMDSFQFGEAKEVDLLKHKELTQLLSLQNIRNNSYRKKLKVKKNYIKWLDHSDEQDYGNLVHKAFSYIHTKNDLDRALSKLVAQGDLKSNQKESLTKVLLRVMHNPQLSDCFSGSVVVKNETEIVLPSGDLLRPDRVVIDNQKATVIDFKTGMRKPQHDEQILSYKIQLENMGYTPVKAKLVYTENNEVIEV